ncbi:hypothetical protein Ndes2437B_g06671 [Nannochloris sp. 'desiccata']|nr:hypothetical protein KSW81_003948 [Chlorella desiccata (nom. nud.)]
MQSRLSVRSIGTLTSCASPVAAPLRRPLAAASSHKARKNAATPPFLGRNTLLSPSPSSYKTTFSPPFSSRLNVSSGNQQPRDNSTPPRKHPGDTTFGEDSAAFDLSKQTVKDWTLFFTLLTVVLGALYAVWIAPNGFGIGAEFVSSLESLFSSSEATIIGILFVFAIFHSGLAYLRPYGEELIGARAYRVIFALVSLPLAMAAVVYFINHRYDGVPLWNLRGIPGVHEAVWITSFISFYFLYPSTFNILEVAAVDEPKLHLWETGIIRITRHPQAVGQLLWCAAHSAWIGSSFMIVTSLGLMVHHAFGCYHGDFRLERKYGDAFDELKARTSTVPFLAILEGRQELPKDYYKEFLRAPYLFLVPFCIGAYLSHPLMQYGALKLGW